MKFEKNKIEKIIFIVLLLISFGGIYIYNFLTPLLSDDILMDTSIYHSFMDVLKQEYWQYHNWNGRSVLQILTKVFTILPKNVFNFWNSLCYVATTLLIYANIKGRKKYDIFLLLLINICIWVFCVDFSQTILWLAGACNYLWGIFIILGYITLYRYYLENTSTMKYPVVAGILLFVTGVLSGWGNENTSGGMILIILLLTGKCLYENKKIEKVMFAGLAGNVTGFLFLLLAPGNAVRSEMAKVAETYTGVEAHISRGLKVIKSIDQHLLLYLVVICLLGTYFYYGKKHRLIEFYESSVFAFGALATAAVLILTPEPMARAYFGANIYMMIAALQIVQMVREEDQLLITLKNGGILAAAMALLFVYVEEGANLVRIRREITIRENYILEARERGESDLTLPMLRPDFESKYSMAHLCDISQDEENWNNNLFCNVYGIDKLVVLTWEEWEEQVWIK